MKIQDFQDDPHHNPVPPVEPEADGLTSNSPAALPTCAPDALLCATRAELNERWLKVRIPTFAAVQEWHALLNFFDTQKLRKELN